MGKQENLQVKKKLVGAQAAILESDKPRDVGFVDNDRHLHSCAPMKSEVAGRGWIH
jgi:hypothetical protein